MHDPQEARSRALVTDIAGIKHSDIPRVNTGAVPYNTR